jgi:hypothetical protein
MNDINQDITRMIVEMRELGKLPAPCKGGSHNNLLRYNKQRDRILDKFLSAFDEGYRLKIPTARRRERRTMDEYITPNYKTIGTVEQRKIRELYTSSLLNAFTQQDYLDAIALIGRVIDRLEKLEK